MLRLLKKRFKDGRHPTYHVLNIKRTDDFGIDDANIYDFVFKADQSFSHLATLIKESDVHLNVKQLLDYFKKRKSYIPLLLYTLEQPFNLHMTDVLQRLNISLHVNIDDIETIAQTNIEDELVPFEIKRNQCAFHVVKALVRILQLVL